jgi:hypothetical protein
MFTKKNEELLLTILIALSFAATGIVFAETFVNSLGYTHNPFSQVEENND